jgi:MFS family permease
MAFLSFLDREHSIAGPGFSRWLIPPAAWAVNLSIGQVYAFSVFKIPLTRLIGIGQSAPGDWAQASIAWIFSLAIGVLGVSAALFGRWVDREGPRKAMFYAAVCFASGFFIAALGIRAHHLWLLYLGYGVVGGVGLGLGYITPVAVLLKWFPDRPGFAAGLAMVGFGGGAMVGSPLSLKLMAHFQTPTDTGVFRTFLVMGVAYFAFMIAGTFLVRMPRPGWKPASRTAASETEPVSRQPSLISVNSVSACDAVATPQFWLLWIVICANATAGFGILEQASPMIQDLFAIGPIAAGGFVGVLSLFNMAGRFFWSSVSDSMGRKPTFSIFLAAGALLYWILPFTGSTHFGSMAAFVIFSGVLISMYGGGFSTIPAYLKDLLGPAEIGAIYGRLQTATSTAGILGPILVNYSRQHELSVGVSKAGAYEIVLRIMAGFLIVGFVANLLVRPVASRFWIRTRPAKSPSHAIAAAD